MLLATEAERKPPLDENARRSQSGKRLVQLWDRLELVAGVLYKNRTAVTAQRSSPEVAWWSARRSSW